MNLSRRISLFLVVLTAFSAIATVSGCGGGNRSGIPEQSAQPTPRGPALAHDPLVESVTDQCGLDTYVGPFRGYELPYLTGSVWSQVFTYSSGLGNDIVSGYSVHSKDAGKLSGIPPRCLDLERMFTAGPVSDDPANMSTYNLALKLYATAQPFPASLAEARGTPSLQAKLTASLVVTVMKPCTQPSSESCWEDVSEPRIFPVEFHCQTSDVVMRTAHAEQLTDGEGDKDYRDAYSLGVPDQCVFRLKDAGFQLASGELIRASIAGSAAEEPDGPRLRILRIALGQ